MAKNKQKPLPSLDALRHSTEHVLTQAMHNLYGKDKIIMAMGPATDDGFYFDFEAKGVKISEADFGKIEKEMQKIIAADLPFKKQIVSIKKARQLFKNNPYKQEWLNEISLRQTQGKKEKATVYWTGNQFVDLCSGPHVKSTGQIKAFKLLSLAGAYWHGDEKNKMLTRLYGTAFKTQKELDHHLWRLEEAKKRDHRRLGPKLNLFIISKTIGKGLPLLTPKGTVIRNQILKFERQLEKKYGFQEVWTPHIAKNDLYKLTGHWDHYRDVMYAPFGIDDETYVLKPMNCPHHYMIYASQPRSYKNLPLRLSEPGTCYRYEKTGELGGLVRVRALTIDDSHILMRPDQIESETNLCLNIVQESLQALGLNKYQVRLSLNDPHDEAKYIADAKNWQKAGQILEGIIKKSHLKYYVAQGEASFYGPKIDFMVEDALGREWQMSTIQLDLFMAKRLNLTYTDNQGKKQHPIIIHRGLTGSIERTLSLLIEHYAGAFPVWLSPIQVIVLPVSEKFLKFAQKIVTLLKEKGLRIELDDSPETLAKKIRNAEKQKIPYMLVVGSQEQEENLVSVRSRGEKDLGQMELGKFAQMINRQIRQKK